MASMATPQRSPAKRVTAITQAQKQALIDNIQLEIAERARKLRAQHALQAQGLRTRLEMRINRIPQALRKRTMQDLLNEHIQRANPKPSAPLTSAQTTKPAKQAVAPNKSKRKSDQISTDENQPPEAELQQDLPNPKKRTKAATANSKATRTASRQQQQQQTAPQAIGGGILSPRSANSRTLPRSPVKGTNIPSPEKQTVTSTTSRLAQPKSTTVARQPLSRQNSRSQKATTATKGRKGVEVEKENQSSEEANSVRESEASNTSAGTTIVKRAGAATKKAATSTKSTATATAKRAATAMAKRVPAAKAAPTARPATAAGGRTLRKRG